MSFDDYNYSMVNQYILLEEQKDPQAKARQKQMHSLSKGSGKEDQINEDKLGKAISEHYDHESVHMPADATPPDDSDTSDTESKAKKKKKKGESSIASSKQDKDNKALEPTKKNTSHS